MSDESTSPTVDLVGVTLRRGRGRDTVMVLQDADLSVRAGELLGVGGPSGAGKSSLVAVLSGELTVDAGLVKVRAGARTGDPRGIRRAVPGAIALIAQDPIATLDALWPIGRSVAEPLRAAGIGRRDARLRAERALEAVGLGHLGSDRRPHELSIGQAQRVCIARAVVGRPAVLLADEVTSALDVTTAAAVVALLRAVADAGAAVIMVSHDRRLLESVSDRRVRLADGRLTPDA